MLHKDPRELFHMNKPLAQSVVNTIFTLNNRIGKLEMLSKFSKVIYENLGTGVSVTYIQQQTGTITDCAKKIDKKK